MKTIFRILIILLISLFVAGVLYLTIENTSLLSGADGFPEGASEFGEPPEISAGEIGELPARPDGEDHHTASLSGGISAVGASLAKLAGITIIVLLVQGLFAWLKKHLSTRPALA